MHELCLAIIAVLLAMFIFQYFTCGDNKGKFVNIEPNGSSCGNTSNLMCAKLYDVYFDRQQACAF